MARKFEKNYVRYLEGDRKLTLEELKTILEIHSEIRLKWGEEYVDFHIENGSIYPFEGSSHLLGHSVSIKVYTPEEFLELISSASELLLMKYSSQSNFDRNLFDKVIVINYFDYPQMITDLEEQNLVYTSQSINILRTDERRFSINKKALICVPFLKEFIGEYYEVDSLGTKFWGKLTAGIEELWSSCFKVVSEKE